MDHKSSQKKLIKMIPKEKSAIVLFCIKALDNVRDDKLYVELLQLVSHDNSEVRVAAVESLSAWESDETIPALEERLAKEKARPVLMALMTALTNLKPGDAEWEARLVEYTEHDVPQVRNAAIAA